MKKYITVAALLAAGTAFANAAFDVETTVVWDLSGATLGGQSVNSLGLTNDVFNVTVATKAPFFGYNTWTEYQAGYSSNTTGDAKLGTISGDNSLFGESVQECAMDYITSSNSITITFTGLTVGNRYDVGLLTGLPFGGAGAWNSVTAADANKDTSTSSTPELGAGSIAVKNTVTGYEICSLIADDKGEIALTINKNSHVASLNGLAISGIVASPVPEPSAFGLLAGIGALALVASRRRRK